MDKEKLRQSLKRRLLEIKDEQRIEKSRKACRNLISTRQFQDASVIMIFLSMPTEIDTTEAILQAWQLGKIIVVPKIFWKQRRMIPVRINSLKADFSTEVAGLKNPVDGSPMPFEDIDLVVTPGLGFDRIGNRIGRGASYYDRFFADQKLTMPKCALAYNEQVVESVLVTETDVPMDVLVTDEEVLYFNEQKGD